MRGWTGALVVAAGMLATADLHAEPAAQGTANGATSGADDLDDDMDDIGDSGDMGGDLEDPLSFRIGTMLALRPIGVVQVQATPYVGNDALLQTGDAADNEGFRLRRARLGFAGTAASIVPFEVSAELVSGGDDVARLLDAWVGVVPKPYVGLYAGARKLPFSRSAMTGSTNSALIERPITVNAMAPYRQVGFALEGDVAGPMFHYSLGMYNGLQRNNIFGEGYVENSAAFGNRFDELAFVGRLSTAPLGEMGDSMADLDHSPFRFGLGSSFVYSNGGTRDIVATEGDFLLHSHGFHFLGEFLWDQAEPERQPTQASAQLAKLERMGAIGEVGYVILPHMLTVAARVEWMDPNTEIEDNGDQLVIAGGFAFHVWEDYAKVQMDFTHREELKGQSLDNDTFVIQLQLGL